MHRRVIAIFLLSVVLLLASGTTDLSIEKDVIPGKVLVQFSKVDRQASIVSSLESKYEYTGLKAEKCLSEQLGIWLLSFDTKRSSQRILLNRLKRESLVENAQFEHYMSLRENIPDDTQFEDQWALKNTGQSSGIPGSDIDATFAWDVSTNTGVSIMGDTLVMAIVDDGFSLGHEDMLYWKNRQEIPNNGVDDDNNGYEDDYDGWNAYYGSGYIQPKDHGQHVAGIAGARGNNGKGVCGVNWNAYVMPVAGSSQEESTVVEAYAYVYNMRLLYDQTNGMKGAYVVVTNSSFGVDYGNPDDYPIWEAMYDSLGSLGILSVAATTNGPWNVDDLGDIPTSFPTDFLIGVTNTTNKDEKNLGAGWGPASIDLGAPGKGILSTRIPNTYGYKTGTSMAAPQVTGSIALMFSAADEAFMQRYAEEPEVLALFMKDLLLDGVDTLPGFDTLCVSGGRLNVNNAIRKLINPHIGLPMDTLRVFMAPDSIREDTLTITNLLGIELPYEAEIQAMPSWISYSTPTGLLAPNGTEELIFLFDATAYAYGKYYCEVVFTDIAGMMHTLVIEMDLSDPQSTQEYGLREISLNCFPNPFETRINISVDLDKPGDYLLNIYSISGKLVYSSMEYLSRFESRIEWDGSDREGNDLPSGIYIIQVMGNESGDNLRVIKSAH